MFTFAGLGYIYNLWTGHFMILNNLPKYVSRNFLIVIVINSPEFSV